MNHKASILMVALAASAAFAQSPAMPGVLRNALSAPASTAAAPASAKSVAPAASVPAKKISPVKKEAKASTPATASTAEAAKKPTGAKTTQVGKRDPFVSPISDRVGGGSGCSTGKKCLIADQVQLQGVVTGPSGMIAVVVNSAKTAYFMRVNDPVFNGYVVKITPDSIVFKETTTDRMGKPLSREVVKKVNIPAV